MADPKPEPKATDPCPACGDSFRVVPPATDAQRAAAANKDNPVPMPQHVDSAPAEQIAELGALHVCGGCGYKTRVKPPKKARAASSTGD